MVPVIQISLHKRSPWQGGLLTDCRSPQGFQAGSKPPCQGRCDCDNHLGKKHHSKAESPRPVIIVCNYLFIFQVTQEMSEMP
jgi:hypothetical protein